jgi:drug/metabolite transporter (DMT)-like permease
MRRGHPGSALPVAAAAVLAVVVPWGALGIAGHFAISHDLARAEASDPAPIRDATPVFGVSYVMLGDVPGLATIAGTLLIFAGALVTRRA